MNAENKLSKLDVATGINPTCLLHEPCFLNEDESWELLQKKASPTESSADSEINAHMEKLGREMVTQCGGLPLAIIVLGGLLVTKPTLSEWKMVHQNLNSYLKRGRNLGEYGRVHEVLALNYQDLPYQVKPCFLRLGNFLEDSKIPARKLYELWAAEGFLPVESYDGGEAESIMDVGQCYLGELDHRYMVQVQVEESTGRHAGISSSSKVASTYVMRRLSVFVDSKVESYFPPKNEQASHVRSLLLFGGKSKWQPTRQHLWSALKLICSDFKMLRVLDLEGFCLGIKPLKAVRNLVHLRYLSFRKSDLQVLPSSVSHLKYLQTLDLRVDFSTYLALPDVIWKLENSRHLYLPPSHKNTNSLKLGSLKKLETLKNFDSRVSHVEDILKLTKLQNLGAIISVDFSYLRGIINYLTISPNHIRESSFLIYYEFCSDVELRLLEQLLGCHHIRKLHLNGHIKKLPEYSHFSSSLTHLHFAWTGLKEDPMKTLDKLPRLHSLILYEKAYVGKEICCSSQGFPKLESLSLQKLPNLMEWKLEPGAMPNLLNLKIVAREKLTMFPDGLTFMRKIKELSIGDMPIAFTSKVLVGNGGEDFHKVQHIPSIGILDTMKWQPPPRAEIKGKNQNESKSHFPDAGEYKLNISARVNGDPGPAGFGGLVRDGQGVWQYGYMGNIGRSTTIEAHLWSIREGLKIAKTKGITRIKVDIHNIETLQLVQEQIKLNEYKLLVEDCKELMRPIEGTFDIKLNS
ncbi:hypothetical protein ACH5RR_032965 [Cinchona calisaya]|uniref:NB-ARC domain-containing protein n=1 Tax=Cinchona calisaya TaxID=153742 RepID=A0ABD2YJM9_9GENT